MVVDVSVGASADVGPVESLDVVVVAGRVLVSVEASAVFAGAMPVAVASLPWDAASSPNATDGTNRISAAPSPTVSATIFRLDSRERRKLFISAEARADGKIVATCRAIYITVDPSRFACAPDPR